MQILVIKRNIFSDNNLRHDMINKGFPLIN